MARSGSCGAVLVLERFRQQEHRAAQKVQSGEHTPISSALNQCMCWSRSAACGVSCAFLVSPEHDADIAGSHVPRRVAPHDCGSTRPRHSPAPGGQGHAGLQGQQRLAEATPLQTPLKAKRTLRQAPKAAQRLSYAHVALTGEHDRPAVAAATAAPYLSAPTACT